MLKHIFKLLSGIPLWVGFYLGLTLVNIGQAQTYPSKAIRIVVPFAPGGTSDILARTIGVKLTEAWGQPVVVENKAGATGNVGADFVAKAPADGHTLLLTDLSVLSINQSVFPNMPFDGIKDFAPVTMVAYSPHAFGVHPSVPVNTVKELIDYAKANPNKLNFAISGTGGAPHLAGIAFAQRTGISWTYIPYKGGSQILQSRTPSHPSHCGSRGCRWGRCTNADTCQSRWTHRRGTSRCCSRTPRTIAGSDSG